MIRETCPNDATQPYSWHANHVRFPFCGCIVQSVLKICCPTSGLRPARSFSVLNIAPIQSEGHTVAFPVHHGQLNTNIKASNFTPPKSLLWQFTGNDNNGNVGLAWSGTILLVQ